MQADSIYTVQYCIISYCFLTFYSNNINLAYIDSMIDSKMHPFYG